MIFDLLPYTASRHPYPPCSRQAAAGRITFIRISTALGWSLRWPPALVLHSQVPPMGPTKDKLTGQAVCVQGQKELIFLKTTDYVGLGHLGTLLS